MWTQILKNAFVPGTSGTKPGCLGGFSWDCRLFVVFMGCLRSRKALLRVRDLVCNSQDQQPSTPFRRYHRGQIGRVQYLPPPPLPFTPPLPTPVQLLEKKEKNPLIVKENTFLKSKVGREGSCLVTSQPDHTGNHSHRFGGLATKSEKWNRKSRPVLYYM